MQRRWQHSRHSFSTRRKQLRTEIGNTDCRLTHSAGWYRPDGSGKLLSTYGTVQSYRTEFWWISLLCASASRCLPCASLCLLPTLFAALHLLLLLPASMQTSATVGDQPVHCSLTPTCPWSPHAVHSFKFLGFTAHIPTPLHCSNAALFQVRNLSTVRSWRWIHPGSHRIIFLCHVTFHHRWYIKLDLDVHSLKFPLGYAYVICIATIILLHVTILILRNTGFLLPPFIFIINLHCLYWLSDLFLLFYLYYFDLWYMLESGLIITVITSSVALYIHIRILT